MICYKDRTFCSSDCTTLTCYRHFGPDEEEGAIKWWGGAGAPVAFSDLSDGCQDYNPPEGRTDET